MSNDETFTITVTMRSRWVPVFLGMLRQMERLGHIGASRTISFFADGDGDFRPKFEWDSPTAPAFAPRDDLWDAG